MQNQPKSKSAATTPGHQPGRVQLKESFRRHLAIRIKLLSFAILAVALVSPAHAGANKVFGAQWAWDNNFNNSVINTTFGTGSTPSLTVSYNFSSYSLYGYPACIRGWHYGFNPANDNLFPMQVSAASSVPCTFSYSSSGSSMAGDFAYDMFLRNDNAKSTPQLEVMVWGGNDSWPIGTQTGTSVLSAGGWTFDLWEGNNTSAGYYVYTFIPHGTAGQGNLPTGGSVNVDMKTFFNWLQANRSSAGHYNNSMYLDVVEAGLEITRGNGSATMSANITASTGGGGGAIANGTYKIINRNSSQALDAVGQGTANGTQIDQWPYSGQNNQRWTVTSLGNNQYKIIGVQSGRSLDVSGSSSANGTKVELWDYSGSNNQKYTFTATSGGYYRITPANATGSCIEVAGSSTGNGALVDLWTYGGGNNQQWILQAP
jgi:Ricin-type beta-trefoil lectin domain-like/Glycosyl hydrolase family 12